MRGFWLVLAWIVLVAFAREVWEPLAFGIVYASLALLVWTWALRAAGVRRAR